MKRWALVDNQSNIVTNIILWDEESPWQPQNSNITMIECTEIESADIGGSYIDGNFTPKPSVQSEVTTAPTVL